jgi:hypothetical protein
MGAQVSSNYSTTKEVSKIVNDVVLSNNSNCSGAVASNQSITLGDVGGNLDINGVGFDSSQTVNLECLQSSINDTEILTDIKKELTKSIQSKLDGQNIGLQMSTNSSYTDSLDDVVNSINVKNIKNCIINAMNDQSIETGNVAGNANIKNISFTSSQNVVQSCMQSDDNTVKAITKLDKKIKEDMSSTITGFISSNGFIIIAVVVALLLFLFFKGKKSKSE